MLQFPLVVFFHGGWWKSKYDLMYAGHLCAALKSMGIAVWSVEYRRVGETGGGWPMTFEDVAAGLEFVATLAESYSIDLERVITMGHSAGGHLAFWAAGKGRIGAGEMKLPVSRIKLVGAIALAGAVDLRMTMELAGEDVFAHDRDEISALMGGTPEVVPERYGRGNPGDLLPFGVPQILIQGTEDDQIPPGLPARWATAAGEAGDDVTVEMIAGADHMDVVDPESEAWEVVRAAVHGFLLR
jgi:acetyl esterase/lipase